MADSSQSFVTNAWYAIGWETDIERSLWHRGLPLSLSRLVGDEVECAYHGFRFAPEGKCTFVPGQEVVPVAREDSVEQTRLFGQATAALAEPI